jgi:4-oxalocrotonate tautomerase
MPIVQITLLAGRTTEQKRRIAERITDVMAEEANAPRDGVIITFVDVATDSYARGGITMKDRQEQQQNKIKT